MHQTLLSFAISEKQYLESIQKLLKIFCVRHFHFCLPHIHPQFFFYLTNLSTQKKRKGVKSLSPSLFYLFTMLYILFLCGK